MSSLFLGLLKVEYVDMDYNMAAHPWYEDTMHYLDTQAFPPQMNSNKTRKLRLESNKYAMLNDCHFCRHASGKLFRCLGGDQSKTILHEFHDGAHIQCH